MEQGWIDTHIAPVQWMHVPASTGGIVAAAVGGRAPGPGATEYERFIAFVGEAEATPDRHAAIARAVAAREDGFDRLLTEHRTCLAERWRDADIVIDGDEQLQTAVRFALYHLMGSARDRDEAAVGARRADRPGLPGPCLLGRRHVRPAVLRGHTPASARAMLEYRIRRLPAAHAQTPGPSAGGRPVPVGVRRFGERRHAPARRATAPAGWSRSAPGSSRSTSSPTSPGRRACYLDWTGDDDVPARGPGRELIVETARYWASRIRVDREGAGTSTA